MVPIDRQAVGRRRFLHGLTFTAASFASFGLTRAFAGVRDETPIILGDGKHRYEWARGWGNLPAGVKLGSMHGGVVVDAQNRVYFSTDGDDSIIVFDQDGKYIRSMGKEWKPDRDGNGTHDMQLIKEGGQEYIYLVSLFRHELAKITLQGEPAC